MPFSPGFSPAIADRSFRRKTRASANGASGGSPGLQPQERARNPRPFGEPLRKPRLVKGHDFSRAAHGQESTVGFSPCIQHRPAIGKGDMKRLAGTKARIIYCFRGGPTEVVPLLQNRPWIAIREIKMRLCCAASPMLRHSRTILRGMCSNVGQPPWLIWMHC